MLNSKQKLLNVGWWNKIFGSNVHERFTFTGQKMKFNITELHSSFLRIWSHLLKKSVMENFIFCAVIIDENVSLGIQYVKGLFTNKTSS